MANNIVNVVINAQNKTRQAFNEARQDLNKISTAVESARRALTGFLAIGFSTAMVKGLIDTADKWLSLNAQIRNATTTSEEFATSQQAVIDISRKTYTSLEANAGLFSKVNLAIKAMGGNTEQSVKAVDQVAKLVALSGTSAESAAAGIFQFTQSLAANRFSGQEYNSVAEQTPALLKAIYEGLNVNIGTLRKMAEEGALDTATVLGAIETSTKRTDAAFAKLPVTFSKASQNMSNAWLTFIGRLNESKGVTQTLATSLNGIADNLELVMSTLAKMATVGALVYFARLSQSAVAYTQSIMSTIAAERAAIKSTQEAAAARVATKTAFLEAAKVKAQDAAASTALIRANLALVKSDAQATAATLAQTNATIARKQAELSALSTTVQTTSIQHLQRIATAELTAAETLRTASIARLATLGKQAAVITTQQTAAVAAQSLAQRVVTASTISQIAAQETLNAVMKTGGVVVGRLGAAFKTASSFLGGGIGVALIGLYALYEVLNKISPAERNAEDAAKRYEDRLKSITETVQKMQGQELQLNLDKASADAEMLKGKIAKLEEFSFDNLKNIGGTAAEHAALQEQLKLTEKQLGLINERGNELIATFDVSQLNPEALNKELRDTTVIMDTLSAQVAALKAKESAGSISLVDSKNLSGLEATLNAYATKSKNIDKKLNDDKAASSQDSLKRSQQKLEELEKISKASYERDLRNLDQSEQAKLTALDQMIPARLSVEEKYNSTKQVVLEAAALSEQQVAAQRLQIEMQANDQRLAATLAFNNQKLADVTRVFDAEIALMRSRNLTTTQLEQDSNTAKKAVLLEIEKAYETSISKLTALDQQHRNKAIALLGEINGQEQNRLTQLRALDAVGLTDTQANELRKRQIIQDTAEVKKLIAAGEYTQAIELSKKLQDLTFKQAETTKTAAIEQNKIKAGTGDDNAAKQARDQYNASVNLTTDALKQAANAETSQANIAKESATKQIESLAEVRKTLADIDKAVTTANTLKVNVDTTEVSAATAAINAIPKDVYTTIHTQTVESHAAGGWVGATRRAVGGFIRGAGSTTGDKIRAWLSDKEYVVKASSVKSLGVGTMDYINQTGQLPAFAAGGAVAKHISQIRIPNMNMVTPSGAGAGKSMGTFDINLSAGGSTAKVTGENTPALQAVIAALQQQKRATR